MIKKIKTRIWKLLPKRIKFIFLKRYVFPTPIEDRIIGLEPILEKAKGKTILDIGSEQGLVSYEFARKGAKLVHGFEINKKGVEVSNIIFSRVKTKGRFFQWDLTNDIKKFNKKFSRYLLKKYDIVLYLGIYNHLKKYMSKKDLNNQLNYLIEKTSQYFVVRDVYIKEINKILLKNNFQILHKKGNLIIYKKTKN